ncbi:MAG: Arm DNA-binding domain-containing protein [Xanthobacteraceae bacterium]|nr:Arm DNA-binding domain-containing protein [Xanthobacteraceae bacterium]
MPPQNDLLFRNLKPNAKPYKVSDGGGLFMLVLPSGSKLWRMAYRFDGKQKLLSFGKYPIISLSKARELRDSAKRQLADGIDPSMAKKNERRRRSAARANTFKAIAEECLKKWASDGDAPKTLRRQQQP